MNANNILMELEGPLGRLVGGINAVELMTLGMAQAKDPYTEGFNAIWNYLKEAEIEVQKIIQSAYQ